LVDPWRAVSGLCSKPLPQAPSQLPQLLSAHLHEALGHRGRRRLFAGHQPRAQVARERQQLASRQRGDLRHHRFQRERVQAPVRGLFQQAWPVAACPPRLSGAASAARRLGGAGGPGGAQGFVNFLSAFAEDEDVIPDLVWISRERKALAMDEQGHFQAAPELVVEVLSPGPANERCDRELKLKLYSRQGVLEYWIVAWRLRMV